MSIVHGSTAGMAPELTLALSFGTNRLYLVGRRDAPLWTRRRGPWQRPITVPWHRLEQVSGHWWLAQRGRELVILGQGPRPALLLEKAGGAWRGFLPAGYQSTVIVLPDADTYTVKPVRAQATGYPSRGRHST